MKSPKLKSKTIRAPKKSTVRLLNGKWQKILSTLPDESVDAAVFDGPYLLTDKKVEIDKLMQCYLNGQEYVQNGKRGYNKAKWDNTITGPQFFKELMRVLKPGAHVVSFAPNKNAHLMVLGMQVAGLHIKDTLFWTYSSGVQKGGYVGKRMKASKGQKYSAKLSAQYMDWAPDLRTATEHIILAQKPMTEKTIGTNVAKYGTGALNIGAVRVPRADGKDGYPTNIITDGSAAVLHALGQNSANYLSAPYSSLDEMLSPFFKYEKPRDPDRDFGLDQYKPTKKKKDSYSRKQTGTEKRKSLKGKNFHLTVKPIRLMQHLVRMVSGPGQVVIDPFMGSNTTGVACALDGRSFIGMDADNHYFGMAKARFKRAKELARKYKSADAVYISLQMELENIKAELIALSKKIIKSKKSSTKDHARHVKLTERMKTVLQRLAVFK
jgi:site-specific DNA-methyltransferase (adenine-specific)